MDKNTKATPPKGENSSGPQGLTMAQMIRVKDVMEASRKKVKPQDVRFVEYVS